MDVSEISAHWRWGKWFFERCHGDSTVRNSAYRNLTHWITCETVPILRESRRAAIHFIIGTELSSPWNDSLCNQIPMLREELWWVYRSLQDPNDEEANMRVNVYLNCEIPLLHSRELSPMPEEEAFCSEFAEIPIRQ